MKSEYREVVKGYLEKYPNMPHRTLTTKICYELCKHEDYNKIYKMIQNLTGKNGVEKRKQLKDKKLMQNDRRPTQMPKEIEYTDYKPKKFSAKKVLVLADIHIPDHNTKSITMALEYGTKKNVDTIILLGDLLDGYFLSSFGHDPKRPSFNTELKKCIEFFTHLRETFPKAQIIYKAGNHDGARLQRYVYGRPELADLEDLSLPSLLRLKSFNIEYVSDMQLVKIGKLLFMHGHEGGGNPNVNIARNLFIRFQNNLIAGHFHRKEEYVDVNIVTRETKASYTVASLCNTQPDYRPYSKYQNGFAVVNFDKNGNFTVDNKLIVGYNVV